MNARAKAILLLAVVMAFAYSAPFWISSCIWLAHSKSTFRNEEIKLPFRWTKSQESLGVSFHKSAPKLTLDPNSGSSVTIEDVGRWVQSPAAQSLWLRAHGSQQNGGSADLRLGPLLLAGMNCGKLFDDFPDHQTVMVSCLSKQHQYSVEFRGNINDLKDAGRIAVPIVGAN